MRINLVGQSSKFELPSDDPILPGPVWLNPRCSMNKVENEVSINFIFCNGKS